MNKLQRQSRIYVALFIIATLLFTLFSATGTVYAESGTIESCAVNRVYRHPVTGVIEDSGGEGSFSTGQGMVEGCVYSAGLFETTSSGECYLTIRLGLTNMTSSHSFMVQSWGAGGWNSTSVAQTGSGSGSDGNGSVDYRIKVPSKDCVVRGSMHVDPMGRDVIFFIYPSGFTAGNSTGMAATIITEEAPSSSVSNDAASSEEEKKEEKKEETDYSKEQETPNVKAASLDTAKGITLSTEKESAKEGTKSGNGKTIAVVLGVVVLICAAGGGVFYLKKNRKGSGDFRDDEE